jgi:hypothetical protein
MPSGRRLRPVALATATLAVAATVVAAGPAAAGPARSPAGANQPEVGQYLVDGVRTAADRAAVTGTGVAVAEVSAGRFVVTGTAAEVRAIQRLGYRVDADPAAASTAGRRGPTRGPARAGFPPDDAGYHDYAEMSAEIARVRLAFPDLLTRFSIGHSYERRDLWAVKISDHARTDEAEPEVLFTCGLHAREHLTVEMCLYLLNLFTGSYATDPQVHALVDSREIYIIFNLNPDGSEYDVATGSYAFWRKNRQPHASLPAVGTDLNRNWNYQWGCCGGSSGNPSAEVYRGGSPFSAPETQRVRDFVRSRRIHGVQQIKVGIDFHSYSELVLWPFGYTTAGVTTGMTADQNSTFVTLGQSMAAANGYTPEQDSTLYVTDGTIDDWLWGAQGIFDFTFEMYPTTAWDGGFYPPDEAITAQTGRNRDAVLRLLDAADCPYKVIGKADLYC